MNTNLKWAVIIVTVLSIQPVLAAPRDQGCFVCARPEIDWQRYANVAYNTYFLHSKYYEGRPQNRVIGDQIIIRGASGCFGPRKDWVLINFKYNWENLAGEISAGPFGARVSIPIFRNNIEWVGQIPDGTQRNGNFVANSEDLRWQLSEMAYPRGARDCDSGGQSDDDHYNSVRFPWGDGGKCLSKRSVFEVVTCAVDRGFRCTCGNHDGDYTCVRPSREGQPLP